MKKINKIIGICLMSVFLFSSCIGDLDTEPLAGSNTLLPEKAWQDEDTYEQFLAKIYAGFALSGNEGPSAMPDIIGKDQGEASFLRSYWNLQQLPTDEVVIAWSDDGLSGLQFCQWTASNRFLEMNFNRLYLNIAYCNEYLRQTTPEKLSERKISTEKQDEVEIFRAEVRGLRAMNYYFLIDLYGNVPFIPEESGVGFYLPDQLKRQDLFAWLETELKDIEQENKLPDNSRANYGKINNPTIWMMLAKLYLNAEVYVGENRYNDCLTYLNKILAENYSIDPVYKNIFGADNDKSPEIIYPIVFDGKRATTYGGITYLTNGAYSLDMNPVRNYGVGVDPWAGIRSTEALTTLFGQNDERGLFYTEERTQNATVWNDFYTGWSVVKFTNMKSDNTPGQDNTFPDTDFPLFRLADAYLMYAEAVLRGGEGGTRSQALAYVNELRDRKGDGKNTIRNSQLTLQFLIEERSRELYWEAHRRTDLIRFNMFTNNYNWPWKNGVQAGTPRIDSKYELFPLPTSEINANPKLIQNQGF